MKLSELSDIAFSQKEFAVGADTGIERDLLPKLPELHSHALVVVGIRRCGKSTLVQQYVNKTGQDYFYMNFEDIRLSSFETEDYRLLDKLIKDSQCKLLFFDEIQNAPKWELYIRQKLNERFRIVLTGSNASMLSKELGTKLTGRHLEKELFPFSYSEFLRWAKKKRSAESLDEYLQSGGFPEYLKVRDADILANLQNDILYRDIAARYKLRNADSLRRLFSYLASNASQKISPSKLISVCDVKSSTTVLEYLSYFESSFLIQIIPQFAWSLKAQSLAPKKVYISDLGLIQVASLSFSKNLGALLENFVFNHLRLQTKELYYFSNSNSECDFIANPRKNPLCIQVCYDMNIDNQDREINGVFSALDFFNAKEGYILTRNSRDEIIKKGKTVHVLPAWEFTGIMF
ncbi:MAG: ATP-binding protein [Fibromonadaceae bacterium]|jgi:predicted AAA+ superfamily ATPase|nr:ATP-binding protein [Fibromonadaceae bacterium]